MSKESDPIESGNLGALVHGALALLGVLEGLTFKSKPAKLLAGCTVGWHAYATIFHLREAERRRSRT